MLHLADYLIVILVLFLSIFIGFTPKLIYVLKHLKVTKSTRHKQAVSAKKKLNTDYDNELNDYDNGFFTSKLTTLYENDTPTIPSTVSSKSKSLEYKTSSAFRTSTLHKATTAKAAPQSSNLLLNTISLVIGFQTTVSIVGLPVEFYYYGFKSLQIVFCLALAPFVIAFLFVPFLYKIRAKSLYEYLDDKFDGRRTVKNFTILISVLFQFIFASCVLFSTAVSVQQILPRHFDIALWHICLFIGLLSACLAFFGLQSVVWANLVQYVIMVGCMVTMIFLGILNYGASEGMYYYIDNR